MSSPAPRLPRSRAWLRVLVLLLALLATGAPVEASAAPVVAGEIAEYDVLDAALRPVAGAPRPVVPLRPAPLPGPAPGVPDRSAHASPRPPYALRALRTVVLRC
ncbi:hypothetical protein OG562_20475 [Streptomyces sp. NBC_01275]|uniref:hypothetical protein n=1 Tax=Streptomyces sp. NBC_01275 TaxID=2903807 RepID=UPI0022516E76|nr:hypothetical protein [Streptomyces sp. NBC_01275]MCX4763302.1 hypothetical protein [Streptomyces sp. NBC_01275]